MPANKFRVEDVRIEGQDLTGSRIEEIYSKTDSYAVYRTPTRVAVQYSDNSTEANPQRQRVIPLNNLRTQINGLINGWRSSRSHLFQSKARRYDGRVAAALVLALDGDTTTPAAALTELRDEIMAERVSWGRFEYLISAFIVAVIVFCLLTLVQHVIWTFRDQNLNLWLAGRAGALGAFFSIALAIRNRTVLTNLRRRDNVSDASLRVMIGAIAGGVLVLLLG